MLDVIIIGAGLSGLLTAYELRGAGLNVLVLDRGQPAREASWAGGGILSPLYPWRYPDAINSLARWSQRTYPALATALREQSAIDPEYQACGLVILEADEQDAACQWAQHWEILCEVVIGLLPEPAKACQALSETSLWFPQIAQVRNPRLTQALLKALHNSGVIVQAGVSPQLLITDERVAGVQVGSQIVSCGTVVVTAGAWTTELSEHLSQVTPVFPVKGQMLLFRSEPSLLSCIVLSQGRYLIPRRDGHILVGSTVENVGFDRRTTPVARQELADFAYSTLPRLRDAVLERQWAGLRPATADGLPYIGEHPEVRGLFVNAGHFRNGVVMGPASARLTADLVLGKQPALDPYPFRLDRNLDCKWH